MRKQWSYSGGIAKRPHLGVYHKLVATLGDKSDVKTFDYNSTFDPGNLVYMFSLRLMFDDTWCQLSRLFPHSEWGSP